MDTETNLFTRLGGTRPMAQMLGEPPSTVQSWKTAGRIPSEKQRTVIEKANAAGFPVTAEDVVYPMGDRPNLAPACHADDLSEAEGAASTGQNDEMSRQPEGCPA